MTTFAWVGPHDVKVMYDLQGLHNVDRCITLFLAVKSARFWFLHLVACGVGRSERHIFEHDVEDLHE